ncbi:hypothetical protein K438DRAFT_1807142 [Mycena galopus ATCC 62051]|nr:hypothetical protein K438DRAFT_1807142 [Mycena galopus ATCC 62051]
MTPLYSHPNILPPNMHGSYQSTTPMASPHSYVSGKASHHTQPLSGWTYQHPLPPTTTPIPYVPLPVRGMPPSSVIFAEDQLQGKALYGGAINQPLGPLGYGPYAPSLPPVPLPYPNQPSLYPSSSSRSSYSSRSAPSSSRLQLHPLLSSHRIEYLISSSSYALSQPQGPLCVPQELQVHNNTNDAAFCPELNCIQIQPTANKADNIIIQSPSALSVAFILQSLHDRLHSAIPRRQATMLSPEVLAIAKASYDARRRHGGASEGMKFLDVLGFGAKDVFFVGLRKGDGDHEWIPVFRSRA